MSRYELVIIGAGSAGLAAARFARTLGVRVALVEAERVGGDCTWTGCVPSKVLLHAAQMAHHLRHAASVGLPAQPVTVDLAAVREHIDAARARVYSLETPAVLAEEGIDILLGPAAFHNPSTLLVGDRHVRGRRFLICTGAAPAVPPIPGLVDGPYLTNHNVFDLTELPERLVVLGGGPVGVELAQAFGRLGSSVTLIGRNPRLLPPADAEASTALLAALHAEGIVVRTGATVERIEREAGGLRVLAKDHAEPCTVEGDAILVALGRTPNVAGLGLEAAGVRFDERGIAVDQNLRTSQPHIYAAGDVLGSFQFTHYAGWQAVLAVRNALLPGNSHARLPSVPWTVFTDPEVAQVGLTEAEARAQGDAVQVRRFPLARNDRAQTAGEQIGLMKVVLRPNGTILGATIVSPAAGEMINEVTVAMDHGIPFAQLSASMHTYPSYGFALQLAAADAWSESLTRGWKGWLIKTLARLPR